jgi:hypothetical protein
VIEVVVGDLRQSGWKGERVVAFEEMSRSGSERNAALFSTPPTMASGSFKSLLIQDREDRRRAREHRNAPRRLPLTFLLREETLKAIEWARDRKFTEEQIPYAAPAAVLLRRLHGEGKVTKRIVLEHCQGKYPHVFGELSRERAA